MESSLKDENYTKAFPPINIIRAIKNNKTYILSGHRYYPKDQPTAKETRVMVEKDQLEGQRWKLISKYYGLYEIIYATDDYGMNEWKLWVDEDKEKKEVYLHQEKCSVFKLITKNNKTFKIQDALSELYLNWNEDNVRDDSSFYICGKDSFDCEWEISVKY